MKLTSSELIRLILTVVFCICVLVVVLVMLAIVVYAIGTDDPAQVRAKLDAVGPILKGLSGFMVASAGFVAVLLGRKVDLGKLLSAGRG